MTKTVAPTACRYFGTKRIHSSSPAPITKMAMSRMTRLRLSPKKLASRAKPFTLNFCDCGRGTDQGKKISPLPLLADNCRNDDCRHHAGRLLHEIARHRLYRRFNHLAHLCDCIASDLALVDREHIDRDGEYAKGRDFLLGNDHVLTDLGDGAWRLGRRHK